MAAGFEASGSSQGQARFFPQVREGERWTLGFALWFCFWFSFFFFFFSQITPFYPHSCSPTPAFSLDFMVVPETYLVCEIIRPIQSSPSSLRSLIKAVVVSSWLTWALETLVLQKAPASSPALMLPLYPPPYIWTLEDKLGFVYSFGRWLDSDLTGT